MQLSVFEMIKKGVPTIIEVVDAFARTELVRLENLINNLATVARTGSYNDLTDKPVIPTPPELSQVAYTGEYDDLLNKPTLFSGNYNDLTNKPTIPTKTSDLQNDSGFITNSDIPSIVNGTYTGASDVTIGGFQVTNLMGLKNCNGFIAVPTSSVDWYPIATTSIKPSTTLFGSASLGGTGVARDVRWLPSGVVQAYLAGSDNDVAFNFNITGY